MANRCEIFLEILIAILLPPLGVFFRHGCCSLGSTNDLLVLTLSGVASILSACEFFICLILTLFGYVPGIVYAIYAIVVRDGHPDDEWRPLNA